MGIIMEEILIRLSLFRELVRKISKGKKEYNPKIILLEFMLYKVLLCLGKPINWRCF